jgi:hypothetical protein
LTDHEDLGEADDQKRQQGPAYDLHHDTE